MNVTYSETRIQRIYIMSCDYAVERDVTRGNVDPRQFGLSGRGDGLISEKA